jgi:hypothetical protein
MSLEDYEGYEELLMLRRSNYGRVQKVRRTRRGGV